MLSCLPNVVYLQVFLWAAAMRAFIFEKQQCLAEEQLQRPAEMGNWCGWSSFTCFQSLSCWKLTVGSEWGMWGPEEIWGKKAIWSPLPLLRFKTGRQHRWWGETSLQTVLTPAFLFPSQLRWCLGIMSFLPLDEPEMFSNSQEENSRDWLVSAQPLNAILSSSPNIYVEKSPAAAYTLR